MNAQTELKKLINRINEGLDEKINLVETEDNQTFSVELRYPNKNGFKVTLTNDIKEMLNRKQIFSMKQETYLFLLMDIVEAYTKQKLSEEGK